MNIARIVYNIKAIVVDGRELPNVAGPEGTEDDNSDEYLCCNLLVTRERYKNKVVVSKKIVEGSISTINQRLDEIMGYLHRGSEYEQAENMKKTIGIFVNQYMLIEKIFFT